jgi:tRNA-2-methylthio-N6-dimethylallyladenosine synthase
MPSVFFETFGCQMNVADSDMLAQALYAKGYYPLQTSKHADLVVVNTCSVRERAEVRAKARIREYLNSRRKSHAAQKIWVIGCMAQRYGEGLKKEIPGIDKVIGAKDIVSFIQNPDELTSGTDFDAGTEKIQGKLSVYIAIMRGCNNYCSYCVVPLVRGEECSVPLAEIETSVRGLVDNGAKEVTLLGQNVNSYHDGETDFPELLDKIQAIPGLSRVRFTTSHPKDCSKKLLETIARFPKLCKHVHLPVQSGSSRILDKMNRAYTREDYVGRIDDIRSILPAADITTDAMVGFPSETEEEFNETLSLFKEVGFTTAFMFAYSKREGTAAAKLVDDIPNIVKKERLSRLIDIQTAITKDRFASMVGKEVEVLFIERQRGGEKLWIGQDGGCKRTLLACNENIAGMILKVKAVRSSGMTLITERI